MKLRFPINNIRKARLAATRSAAQGSAGRRIGLLALWIPGRQHDQGKNGWLTATATVHVAETSAENSDVLPFGSVAVALIACPAAAPVTVAVKLALPLLLVATVAKPRKIFP